MMLYYHITCIMSLLIYRCQFSSCYYPNVVQDLISELGWNSAIFIYDHTSYNLFANVTVQQQHYNIDRMEVASVLHSIHVSTSPIINILIAVSSTRTRNVINTIDWFKFASNKYRHHSRILVLMNMTPYNFTVQHLENVAVCALRNYTVGSQRLNTMCSTLIIHPHERVFVQIPTAHKNTRHLFPNLSKGYNNRLLKVSTLSSPPYTVKRNTSNTLVSYSGYLFDIWKTIVNKLNLSYEVVEPGDMSWGSYKNGRWNGIVGQLINEEVDIAVADLSVTAERSEVIDFIFPSVMVDTTDIIYKRQQSQLKTFSVLLGPLSSYVYLVLLSVWIFTAVLYVLLDQRQKLGEDEVMAHIHCRNICGTRRMFSVRTVVYSIWSFMATLLKQDFPMTPSSTAGSMLLSSWLFLVLLITSVYCANLIAALSSQSGLSRLSSIDELVDSEYTTGMFTTGLPYETMQRTERPELKRLFAKMLERNKTDAGIFNTDLKTQLTRVKNGGHSLIMYRAGLANYVTTDCQLAFLKESITMTDEYISFAVPKGSPFKHDIEKILSSLRDTGILDILWKNWTQSNNRTCDVGRDQSAISLREVSGGLLLVCAGLGFACAVLFVEICQRCSQKT